MLTICLEDILQASVTPGRIDYLKVDCEGAEYDFLTGKDLSGINYMEIELHHDEPEKKQILREWIAKTHDFITGDWNQDHNLKCLNIQASPYRGYGFWQGENMGVGEPRSRQHVNTDDDLYKAFSPRVGVDEPGFKEGHDTYLKEIANKIGESNE